MKLTRGQKIRLKREVATFYVDSRYEYPGIRYDDYARLHSPIALRAGTIAVFEHYLWLVPGLNVLTDSTEETPRCDVFLGRTQRYLIEVPSDSIEPYDEASETTPLLQCAVDSDALAREHFFREDP